MGCCCSKQNTESNPLSSSNNDRTSSIPSEYSSLNKNKLVKTFSEQVEKIKSQDKIVSKFLDSSLKSSLDFTSNLNSLNFYYSQKDLSDPWLPPEDLICPNCSLTYSLEENKPMNLACGHLLCDSCISLNLETTSNIQCPFNCNLTSNPEALTVNSETIEKIKSINSGQYCFKHNIASELLCFNCREIVCEECINDHPKHNVKSVLDPAANDLIQKSLNSLSLYQKNLEENLKTLTKTYERFQSLQKSLQEIVDERKDLITENSENLVKNLEEKTQIHEAGLKSSLEEITAVMPMKIISLYYDTFRNEQEKVKIVLEEVKDESRRTEKMSLAQLASSPSLSNPDFQPWEKLLTQISALSDIEFLLLALTSLSVTT